MPQNYCSGSVFPSVLPDMALYWEPWRFNERALARFCQRMRRQQKPPTLSAANRLPRICSSHGISHFSGSLRVFVWEVAWLVGKIGTKLKCSYKLLTFHFLAEFQVQNVWIWGILDFEIYPKIDFGQIWEFDIGQNQSWEYLVANELFKNM